MAAANVRERTLAVDGVSVFYREVEGEGPPAVYCHGNPTHSEDWLPFLERGGPAIAIDLPGWGRSDRPADFDYTMHGLSSFLHRCLEQLGVGDHSLVVHDWGSLALIEAQRRPEALRRLVIINAVPLLPGYRWHWIARLWRRRGVGELLNATSTRAGTALLTRQARGDRSPMPADFIDMVWRYWDKGTRRAVLELYRDADPPKLAAAGADLAALSCPALVLWGEREPYLPVEFAHRYAAVLPAAELDLRAGAGHWPWLDDPSVVDRVLRFIG
jgi:pimeloyl-ACP methyl ester carboxylesterase